MGFSLSDALNGGLAALADAPVLGAVITNPFAAAAMATAMAAVVAIALGGLGSLRFRPLLYGYLGLLGLFALNFYAADARARARYGGAATAGIVDSLSAYSGAAEAAGRRAPDLAALGAGYGGAFGPAPGAYGGAAYGGGYGGAAFAPPGDAPPGYAWVRADNLG